MIFEKGLEAVLKGVAGFEEKIFPIKAPQGTHPPYMVYRLIKSKSLKTLNNAKGYLEGTYQVDCINNNFEMLKENMKTVKTLLSQCLKQNIGGTGPYIHSITFVDEFEKLEMDETAYHGIIQCKFIYDPY